MHKKNLQCFWFACVQGGSYFWPEVVLIFGPLGGKPQVVLIFGVVLSLGPVLIFGGGFRHIVPSHWLAVHRRWVGVDGQ